jgi:class 3 adenylate cyclase
LARAELPSGTVTFLFTDIEGSTRLLHELGEGYAEVLAEHRRVLRESFARHGGIEVDTQGDALFVAFARASDAVAGAQEALVRTSPRLRSPRRGRTAGRSRSRTRPTPPRLCTEHRSLPAANAQPAAALLHSALAR